MNLPPCKTMRFVHPMSNVSLDTAEPNVTQIRQLIMLEASPGMKGADQVKLTLAKLEILLTPPRASWTPLAFATHWFQRRKVRRFVGSLSYHAALVMVNSLILTIHGVNVDDATQAEVKKAEAAAKKKGPETPTPSSATSPI